MYATKGVPFPLLAATTATGVAASTAETAYGTAVDLSRAGQIQSLIASLNATAALKDAADTLDVYIQTNLLDGPYGAAATAAYELFTHNTEPTKIIRLTAKNAGTAGNGLGLEDDNGTPNKMSGHIGVDTYDETDPAAIIIMWDRTSLLTLQGLVDYINAQSTLLTATIESGTPTEVLGNCAFIGEGGLVATTFGDCSAGVDADTSGTSSPWVDVIRFTQVLGDGGAKVYTAKLPLAGALTEFDSTTALSAAAVRNFLGRHLRVKYVVTNDSDATVDTSFTFSVTGVLE